MKFSISILSFFLFVSCAAKPAVYKEVSEKTKEKNKQIAIKNQVTEAMNLAQKLEQQGRDLQPFRDNLDAESTRQCNLKLEARRNDIANLEDRVNKLPENYKNKLMPIVAQLNECVSCERKTLDDCKKARASINQTITELYP